MKMIQLFRAALMPVLLGLLLPAHAEDIDIYSDFGGAGATPNLMFVIDSSANSDGEFGTCTYWDGSSPSMGSKTLGNEQCALANIVHTLPKQSDGTALINLGITTSDGVFFKLTPIDDNAYTGTYSVPGGTTNRQAFVLAVKAMTKHTAGVVQGDQMQETWAYYTGGNGGTTGTGLMSGVTFPGTNATTGCQKNFAVFLGSADRNSHAGDNGSGSASTTILYAAIDNTTSLTTAQKAALKATITNGALPDKYTAASNAREWARFMYRYDANGTGDGVQDIVTYTLSLGGANVDMTNFIKDMATFGGGKPFNATSYSQIVNDILGILNEVQAVNSVFSSASLPVSVNAQGTYLNQIFLGMFRPDPNAYPRWLGNLKQYQFILTSSGLQLGDSTGAAALSAAGTGFISPNAISFWTNKDTSKAPDSTGGFFKNDPHGAGGAYDSPDGELVEKGGVAQQLRTTLLKVDYSTTPTSPRKLFTYCPGGTSCAASLGDTSNVFATTNTAITVANLGVADSTARTSLINWVRGEDNKGDELGPDPVPRTNGYTVRPSIHGDVVHSRPVVINYGDAARGLVVFYGANDGVFRAVNGNQTAAIGSVPAGGELWGLVLPEHFARLNRQRDNQPEIHFPADNSTNIKDYFVDGSAGVYQKLKADGTIDKAYLYLTMRRGGRFIYALDVSDPAAPTVLWRVKSSDSGFSELGQTWSRPRVTLIKGYANPVLVFGAGYDPAEDAEPPTADSMGRGIFVLDALTGARVWSATYTAAASTSCSGNSTQAACAVSGMNWAIPADISFVDRDNDGKTDRFYAADLGGNVWRVDLEPTGSGTPDTWQVSKLAAVGCDAGVCASGTTPRKFFYPPNVVPVGATGAANAYDAVLLGSGDREHPLKNTNTGSAYNVANRFYMFKDTRTGKNASVDMTSYPLSESNLFDATSATYPGTAKGFYMTLATGEKVVNASITVTGTTFFGTNRPKPSSNSCIPNLGEAKGYALNPFQATYNSTIYDGGGLPPTPVAGIVSIRTADGSTVQQQFCVGCGGTSAIGSGGDTKSSLGATDLTKKVPKKPRRTYWYKR
jgi:type IV pilus assembly protein PilY1